MNAKFLRTLTLATLAAAGGSLNAASVDLASTPMGSGIDPDVKPNVMFILDSSGSMAWTHVGDVPLGSWDTSTGSAAQNKKNSLSRRYGYASVQCNPLYFDPSVTYSVPVMADGSLINAATPTTFTAAYVNGFKTSDGVVNLSTQFQAYTQASSYDIWDDPRQPAYYFKYTGSVVPGSAGYGFSYSLSGSVMTVDTLSTFYKECASMAPRPAITYNTYGYTSAHGYSSGSSELLAQPGSGDGSLVFTKVNVALESAAVKQNFANWYSYYRTRMLMMKSATGIALKQINNPEKVRIGSVRVEGGSVSMTTFVPVRDYGLPTGASATNTCPATVTTGQDQRSCLYKDIYDANPNGGTPTRTSLDYAGQMYKGTGSFVGTGKPDPVLYSCQRNATILASDGFWNTDSVSTVGNADSGGTCPYCDTSTASSNSMADIAAYYYKNDLRTSGAVSANNVPTTTKDPANWQHMNTFTLGLGAPQYLKYKEGYEDETLAYCASNPCSDYLALTSPATKSWPNPMPNENLTRIDDLWHAAVNGRGTFFNANNVSTLSNGLKKAFAEAASGGSGGAAATGNLAPAAGDNEIYLATFRLVPETSEASGDVNQYPIDPDTGIVSTTAAWSARTKLDARVSNFTDSRNILMASGPTSLVQFDKANLTTAIANKWFSPGTDNPSGPLEQYSFYSAAQITNAAKPENMIAYLRGQRGWEDPANNVLDADPAFGAKLFRGRAHVLGDIVNSSPVYVKKPAFDYQDTGYAAFVSTPRSGVVYVGANDGMLHAFDSVTGEEKWAFIPTAVMPYLYKLADKNYVAKHRYYVNGALTIGDVDFSTDGTDWRTVLIGGLGLGGRAFFALDITNPDSPSLLWEFSAKTSGGVCVGTTGTTCDEDLGYSYGNAQMAKLDGGAWVAFFPSGYNNVAPPASPPPPTSPPALTGDGDSRLYVVNLKNGAKLKEIPTGSGSDPSLNGIAWVNGWTDDGMRNNSVKHVYGGDLSGRVWRFDITGSGSATLLTKLGYAAFGDQPVTTRPELGDFVGDIAQRVVYVGTGRYLGFSDIDNVDIQSLYAIRDSSASPKSNVGGAGLFRSSGAVKLFSAGDRTAGLTYNAVTSNSYGWYMDFTAGDPVTGKKGERITVNPLLYPDQLNLSVVTNLPSGDKCDVGGKSWAYFLNTQPTAAKSAVMADTVQYVGSALAAGSTNLTLESGKRVTVITKSDGSTVTLGGGTPAYGNKVRRVSWRELRN